MARSHPHRGAGKDEVGQAICADATDIDVLRTVGVVKADTAVVADLDLVLTAALEDLVSSSFVMLELPQKELVELLPLLVDMSTIHSHQAVHLP